MRRNTVIAATGLFLLAMAGPALAHTGSGAHVHGFTHGFLHPFSGLDHLLAMAAVGVRSALAMPRRIWLAPLAFVAAMLIGAGAAMAGIVLPAVEPTIAFSVIALGFMIAARFDAGLAAGSAIVGGFALFHGNAHGLEVMGSLATYTAGFTLATGMLHAIGIALGVLMTRARFAAPLLGSAVAASGLWLLIG